MKEHIKNIVVLGSGESGVGAALLAKAKGYNIFVSDLSEIKDNYKAELQQHNIEFEEGKHTEERVLSADLIIKSPGIPDKAFLVKAAYGKGIPVISEIEFASWFTKAKCIGITGTNGKTTTTSLTYHILSNSQYKVGLGGNIGKSFARSVADNDDYDFYVLELSSFQLDGISEYKNYISVLLNITPDHLDRYEYSYEKYIESKFRITLNQTENEYFIYNYDDEIIRDHMQKHNINATLMPISLTQEVFPGAYFKDETLIIGIKEKNEFIMRAEDLSLQGKHNRYNTMASGVVSKIIDVRKEAIRESLKSFQNVEHRLESVASIGNVEYINDSKATNINATWYALESMNKPVIWIAGGIDKGNDYESLKPLVRERVKAMICLGKDNKKLHEAFHEEVGKIIDTYSMKEAVKQAAALASPGDVVLLAPACASFDLFQNYEDRGRQFKNAVLSL